MTLRRPGSALLASAPIALPNIPADGLVPGNFTNWRKALTTVNTGTGFAKLLVVGDSIVAGINSTGGNPRGPGGAAWPSQMLKFLNSSGFAPTTFGLTITSEGGPTDTRWGAAGVLPTGWANAANVGWGNNSGYVGSVSATNLPFAPGINCDTFDVYYIQYPSDGTFQVNIDGGTNTVVNSAGTASVQKVTLTATAGSTHIVNFNTVTVAGVIIVGVDAYLSTSFSIRVGNAGRQSSATAAWSSGTAGINSVACIQAYAPDLTIISLGTNDAALNSSAASVVALSLHTLIVAAQASGDVIVTSNIPNGQNTAWETLIQTYITAIQEQALQDNVGYVDLHGRWVSYTVANARGLFSSDHTHPNNAGYSDIASAMVQVLMAIGGTSGGTAATIDTVTSNIAASAPGDTGLAGAKGFASDSGHKHPREAWGVATDYQTNGTAAAGSVGKVADSGHVHPTVPGQLLATNIYNPSTASTYTTTSATYADVDGTNLTLSVVAPTSGTIDVELEALVLSGATSAAVFWALTASNFSSGALQPSNGKYMLSSITANRLTTKIHITGLTAGTTYVWHWQWATTSSTAHMYAGGPNSVSTSVIGPASMRAYAA